MSSQNIKKISLSTFLILIFAVYIIVERTSAENMNAIPPFIAGNKKSSLNPVTPSITPSEGNSQNVDNNSPASHSSELPSPIRQVPNAIPKNTLKDGEFTGMVADAYYGNVQIKAIIQNGKITGVQFLDYPSDRRNSVRINTQAMPMLQAEAIQAQNAKVDVVSGATYTSQAFQESLADALAQAKN